MPKAEKSRRLTGVKKGTFRKMPEVLEAASERSHERGGRPAALPMADRLLLTLEYLREHRTYRGGRLCLNSVTPPLSGSPAG